MSGKEFRHNPISGEETGIHEMNPKERRLAELRTEFQETAAILASSLSQSSDSITPIGIDDRQLFTLEAQMATMQDLIRRATLVSAHEYKQPSQTERESLDINWFRAHMHAYLSWVNACYYGPKGFEQAIDQGSLATKRVEKQSEVDNHFSWLESHTFGFNSWIAANYPGGVAEFKQEILDLGKRRSKDLGSEEQIAA